MPVPPSPEEARGMVNDLYSKASDAAQAGNRYVSERPWPAIGIAFVAGLAVGMLATRHEEESTFETLTSDIPEKLGLAAGAAGVASGARHFFKQVKFW